MMRIYCCRQTWEFSLRGIDFPRVSWNNMICTYSADFIHFNANTHLVRITRGSIAKQHKMLGTVFSRYHGLRMFVIIAKISKHEFNFKEVTKCSKCFAMISAASLSPQSPPTMLVCSKIGKRSTKHNLA